MFNLDVSCTVFYNIPPRLKSSELQVDMPCSLPVFGAQTPLECSDHLLAEPSPSLPQLPQLVRMYFDDQRINPDQWATLEFTLTLELNVMHHFILILGLWRCQRDVCSKA